MLFHFRTKYINIFICILYELLLQEESAKIRVEALIREIMVVETMEILELYCELLSVRTPILEKSGKQMPEDLREAITTTMFACPRLSIEIPELKQIASYFRNKFGHDFAKFAMNEETAEKVGACPRVTMKLAVVAPSLEYKMEKLKEVAAELGVVWEPDPSELQNLELSETAAMQSKGVQALHSNKSEHDNCGSNATLIPLVSSMLPEAPSSMPMTKNESNPNGIVAPETNPDIIGVGTQSPVQEPAPAPASAPLCVSALEQAPRQQPAHPNSALVENGGIMFYRTAAEAAAAAREFADKAAAAAEAAAALALIEDGGETETREGSENESMELKNTDDGSAFDVSQKNDMDETKVHELLNSAIQAAEAAEFAAEVACTTEDNDENEEGTNGNLDIDAAIHALTDCKIEASAPLFSSGGTDIFATSTTQSKDSNEFDTLAKRFEALKKK